jgi:serine/threonine protein kinase
MNAKPSGGSSASSSFVARLDQLCDRFEDAWRARQRPSIDAFLQEVADAERPALLRELIGLEIHYRALAGEAVAPDEYRQRFPDHQSIVTAAFEDRDGSKGQTPATPPSASVSLDSTGPDMDVSAHRSPAQPDELDPALRQPPSGPQCFRVVRAHAKGGLGEVYRARDENLHRDVALKRIQPRFADNPECRRRFLVEAEVTARLEHPGVVPVHGLVQDADGQPCYAMRFIRGESLHDALQRFHAADGPDREAGARRLAVRQLLSRFLAVCNTIAYAHSRGILHRDLKPQNIMLGQYGETLVVDWGLAKAFSRNEKEHESGEDTLAPTVAEDVEGTRPGQAMGTPAYMSPEQAAGQWERVGPATDIYGLGATLYALLTGRPPFLKTDTRESIQLGAFPPPQQVAKEIPRALEAICLKAMSRQPEERYRTAPELAADVEHWLADEPVEAYREPAMLRAGRWLRKHRPLMAGLAAAAAVALVSLTVGIWVVAQKAAAERQAKNEAQKRLAQIEKGTDLLGSIFADLDPGAEEKEGKLLREILGQRVERVASQLEAESIADALVVAKLQNILGSSLNGLGYYGTAADLLERSSATRANELGDDHPDTLESRTNLAHAYANGGQLDLAIPLAQRVLETREAQLGDDHSDILMSRNTLADAFAEAGKLELAIPLYERALKAAEAKLGDEHLDILKTRNNLAGAYQNAGQLELAIPLFQRILKIEEAKLGNDHRSTLTSRNNLARAYLAARQPDRAIPLLEHTVKASEAKLGDDHPDTLRARDNLASAYQAAGRVDLAIALHERTVKAAEAKLGDDHPDTLKFRNNLASTYHDAGRLELTIPLLQRTLKASEAKLGDDHPDTLLCRNNLAHAYKDTGQIALAISLFERVVPQLQNKLGFAHPWTKQSTESLITALIANRQYSRAVKAHKELILVQRKAFGTDDPRLATALGHLGDTLLAAQQPLDAESVLRESLAIRAKHEPEAWTTFNTQSMVGAALVGQKKYAEAEPLLLRGYEGMKKREANIPPQGRIRLTEALQRLVQLYEATGKNDEVAKWRKELDATKAASKNKKER